MAIVRDLIVTSDIKIWGESLEDSELAQTKNPTHTIQKGTNVTITEKRRSFSVFWKDKINGDVVKNYRVNISNVFLKHLEKRTRKIPQNY